MSIPGGIAADWGLEMGDEVADGLPMAKLTGCSVAAAEAYLNLEFALETGLGGRPFPALEDGRLL